jgi:hypothetical protein
MNERAARPLDPDRTAIWDREGLMCPRCGGVVDVARTAKNWGLQCLSCRRGLDHPDANSDLIDRA